MRLALDGLPGREVVLFVRGEGPPDDAFVAGHRRCWEDAGDDLGAVVSPPASGVPAYAPEALWAAGGNLSVRADLLGLVDRFDRDGWDVDLCLRLRRRRLRVEVGPAAAGAGASAWRLGVTAHRVAARHAWLARTCPPGAAVAGLGLLGTCLAAAVRWGHPAVVALGAAVVAVAVVAERDRVAYELGYVLEGMRRGDIRALWRRVPPGRAELPVRLAAATRSWIALAASASLAVLVLAALAR